MVLFKVRCEPSSSALPPQFLWAKQAHLQNNNDDQSALCTTSSPSFTPKEEMSFLTFLLFCSVTINHNKLRHTLYFILLTFVCTPFFLEHYYICMNTTTTITSYLHYAHGFFLFPSMNCLGTPGVRNV